MPKEICPICSRLMNPYEKEIFDTRFGVEGLFDFYHCSRCDLGKLGQIPTSDDLKKLYENFYNSGGRNKNMIYDRFKSWFFSSVFYRFWMKVDGDICFHSNKGQGMLLDVGCNDGSGLVLYQKNGFITEGLELNDIAAQAARDKGFAVFTGEIEKYTTEKRFEVVVLSNVLEHSDSPLSVLKHTHRLLKPSGEVWISTPNMNSLFKTTFQKFWINWHAPFHICLFSIKALVTGLNKTGFKMIKKKNISPALWNAQSIIARLFSKEGKKTRQYRNPILILLLMFLIRLIFFPALYVVNHTDRGDGIIIRARKTQSK